MPQFLLTEEEYLELKKKSDTNPDTVAVQKKIAEILQTLAINIRIGITHSSHVGFNLDPFKYTAGIYREAFIKTKELYRLEGLDISEFLKR